MCAHLDGMNKIVSTVGFLSLLTLSSCTWFGGGDSDSKSSNVVTAQFELVDAEPVLSACEGTAEVAYRVSKCLVNGVEGDLSRCSGMSKPSKVFKSPAGQVSLDIKNNQDQVIGNKKYQCEGGKVVEESIRLEFNCTDSRYIKQEVDNILYCNPYLVKMAGYRHVMNSEKNYLWRIGETNKQVEKGTSLQTFVDYVDFFQYGNFPSFILPNNEIQYLNFNLYPSYVNITGPIKKIPFDPQCLMDIHNNISCLASLEPQVIELLQNSIDIEIAGNNYCAKKEDGKVFCLSENSYGELGLGNYQPHTQVPIEIPQMENSEVLLRNGYICYNKEGKSYCSGAHFDNLFYKIFDEEIKDIHSDMGLTCALTKSNKFYCYQRDMYGILGRGVDYYFSNFTLIDQWQSPVDYFYIREYFCVRLENKELYCAGDSSEHSNPYMDFRFKPFYFPGYN